MGFDLDAPRYASQMERHEAELDAIKRRQQALVTIVFACKHCFEQSPKFYTQEDADLWFARHIREVHGGR